jgi:hypothetical protein
VRGLNTAATVWCSAAVGVLAGASYPAYAALATAFVLFVNLLLRPIVTFINKQPLMGAEVEVGYLVSVTCRSPDEAHVRTLPLQEGTRGRRTCAAFASTATISRGPSLLGDQPRSAGLSPPEVARLSERSAANLIFGRLGGTRSQTELAPTPIWRSVRQCADRSRYQGKEGAQTFTHQIKSAHTRRPGACDLLQRVAIRWCEGARGQGVRLADLPPSLAAA